VRREHLVPCGESDQARRASRRAAYQEVEAERRRTRGHTPPDPASHRGHGHRLSESSPHRARADAKRRSLAPAGSGRYFELKLETLIRRQVVAGPRNDRNRSILVVEGLPDWFSTVFGVSSSAIGPRWRSSAALDSASRCCSSMSHPARETQRTRNSVWSR
jgi:hypothetical protein